MNSRRSFVFWGVAVLAVWAVIASSAQAQQPMPHIGYVYPAGGRQGTEFQVTIGGQFLDGVDKAIVSGPGVQATVVAHTKPLSQKQFNDLREKLQELQKKPRDAETSKQIMEIRQKLATFIKRPLNPAIAETVTLKVTLAADAQPAARELRLHVPSALTNPVVFCVGQLPEFSEAAAKAVPDTERNKKGARYRLDAKSTGPGGPTEITAPAVLNGQIMPGAVDRYRIQGRKGQQLVVATSARELMPYLPDAVPGWFQAAVTLYDAQGDEVAFADHFQFHPDPVLYYKIPADGPYLLEVRDSIYRGREDFVYRIAIGEFPFVTSVFPLGGQVGAQTTVELKGWNLPATRLPEDGQGKGPGIYPLALGTKEPSFNRVPFAWDALPECAEREPNDQPGTAQPVTLPVIVNGRIDRPGDADVFRFEGAAGQVVVAEVYARRLNSPLDSVLRLTDAAGRQLAFNDDHEDKGSGLNTHHADSYLTATLPAAGTYFVHLGDVQHKGGSEFAYRLRISPPQPDFELRVVPSSISIRGGTNTPITVYALRKDGFGDEIALALKNAPAGFTLSGARVPAHQDQVRLTLSGPPSSSGEPITLHLEGRATITGQKVTRSAMPAEDMMQAFAYRHLVPAQELKVNVAGRWMPRAAMKVVSELPVKIPAGGTSRVQISVPLSMVYGKIQLQLDEPPPGIALGEVTAAGSGTEITLKSDAAKAKPGLQGNLIVQAFVARDQPAGKGKNNMKMRLPVGTLPAIPFEIVGL